MVHWATLNSLWLALGIAVGFYMGIRLEAKKWRENANENVYIVSDRERYKVIQVGKRRAV